MAEQDDRGMRRRDEAARMVVALECVVVRSSKAEWGGGAGVVQEGNVVVRSSRPASCRRRQEAVRAARPKLPARLRRPPRKRVPRLARYCKLFCFTSRSEESLVHCCCSVAEPTEIRPKIAIVSASLV
jgi:hypothetical protein